MLGSKQIGRKRNERRRERKKPKTAPVSSKLKFNILFKTWNFVTIVIHRHSYVTRLHRPLLLCSFRAREDHIRKFVTINVLITVSASLICSTYLSSLRTLCRGSSLCLTGSFSTSEYSDGHGVSQGGARRARPQGSYKQSTAN